MEHEEMPEAIRRAAEHQRQHIDAHQHDVRRLFAELPQEHLETLNDLFAVMAASGENAAGTAAHFHGVAKVYLETRFNICVACGTDHDKAAQELAEGATQPSTEVEGQEPLPFPKMRLEFEQSPGIVEDKKLTTNLPYEDLSPNVFQFMEDAELTGYYGPFLAIGESGRLNLPQVKMMEVYKLDDMREEGTNKLLGFVCLGCGLHYQSIEDRMLKGPEDCHGCHFKSAHG